MIFVVGGEIGKLQELLMEMGEARDKIYANKGANRAAQKVVDEEKESRGQERIAVSLKRKSSDKEGISISSGESTPCWKKEPRFMIDSSAKKDPAEKDLGKFGKAQI